MKQRYAIAHFAVCAALLACVALFGGCRSASGESVVVGVAGPLETSYGANMLAGAELAAEEINARGGIRGRQLELRPRDDRAEPQTAIGIADEFVSDPTVIAVVGHVNSSTTLAAGPVYERGLAAVATSATSPEVSKLGDFVFRTASSDSANAVALARLARSMNVPTSIMYANDDYGRGLATSFRAAFEAAGGRVLYTDPYLEDMVDFRPYLVRLQRADAGLIFIAGLEGAASRIISQAREMGVGARFLGGDGLEGLVGMGGIYDGTLVGLLYHPDANTAARQFADRYRQRYGRDPDSFAALGYDALRLVAEAISAAGTDRAAVQRYLARVGTDAPAFAGATGNISFDYNGDPVDKGFAVGAVDGGQILLNAQNAR